MYLRFDSALLNYNSTLIQYEKVNNSYLSYSEYFEHMSIEIAREGICITEHKIRQMLQIIVLMNR